MSRHEGVSCDACLKNNFKGRRYKCLRCYDYDLCASCFEGGASTSRHTPDHPVQCILSRSDFDLYYSGESASESMAHSLTCPVCGRLGFTEPELQSHVTTEHQSCTTEVVCPICASMPGGEPNLVTDDFTSHLTIEHRQQPRDNYVEDAPSARHSIRRVQQPSRTLGVGRGRRPNMHFSSGGLSPSGARETVDPIAELLSQLSGVRRAAAVPYDRLLHQHRHAASSQQSNGAQGGTARRSVFPPPPGGQAIILSEAAAAQNPADSSNNQKVEKHQFLLDKCLDSQRRKDLNPDQSMFLQDLLLATMTFKDNDNDNSNNKD